ncbi:hypothetical protein BX600DRAFT_461325 [Xylariales sp. PMI_506]|nr:hypothetical protein BX600DRAFT_461325 [Xylariales sp. PMI_506]
MGFHDFSTRAGLNAFNTWVKTRSYVVSHSPSQADVTCFKAIKSQPYISQYPHAARWYRHIASYESEFETLPGDSSKAYTTYGPEDSKATAVNLINSLERDSDSDDIDLFATDDEKEDAEVVRAREARLAAYREKKATKPKIAAKSVVIIDVKPWDDETDMVKLEAAVRSIQKNGLVWGTSKLVAVGFGIKKLQINLVVEDDKVSTQDLQDEIEGFEEYVQSSDVVAFQKL